MKTDLIKAKQKELKEIAKIYRDEFSKPPYEENWTKAKSEKKMKSYYKNCDVYSIKVKKELAGFIVVNKNFMCPGEVAFGEEFAIKEGFKGKGIGTYALKKIMEIYKAKGYSSFMGIASKKSKALKLYNRLGIKESREGILVEKEFKK